MLRYREKFKRFYADFENVLHLFQIHYNVQFFAFIPKCVVIFNIGLKLISVRIVLLIPKFVANLFDFVFGGTNSRPTNGCLKLELLSFSWFVEYYSETILYTFL